MYNFIDNNSLEEKGNIMLTIPVSVEEHPQNVWRLSSFLERGGEFSELRR
jgi:hypothetical protein